MVKRYRRLSSVAVLGGVVLLVCLGSAVREGVGQSHTTVAVRKVDVNTATRDELRDLPGVGEILADKIIRHRPYRKLDDLVSRKVLGRKQMARIKAYVTVSTNGDSGRDGSLP